MSFGYSGPGVEPVPDVVTQFPSHPPRRHTVQFYSEDQILLDEVSRFIGTALGAGDAAIVIATPSHMEGLTQNLLARGLNVAKVAEQARYIPLDAILTLSKITVDGLPDWSLFSELIASQIERAQAAVGSQKQSPVVIFGEMVALLWADGNTKAVLRLEQFWNELAKTHDFSLRCAYPIGSFYREEHGEPFLKICEEHSLVIPGENYTLLTGEEQRLRSIAYLQQRAQALETELALRRTEERFRLLVEAVQDYAIFMLDPKGHVTTWNKGAERIKGYESSEIIGKHFSCFYPGKDLEAGKPQRELEIAARDGRLEDEGWRVRKDGTRFWANVIITALRDDAGNLLGFTKVTRDFTERMLAEQSLQESQRKLQDSEKSLRELSFRLLRTQDEERRRIGRELHDGLGQNLLYIKIKMESLKSHAKSGNTDEVVQGLAECASLAEESVKEVRTISYLMYPPMLEELGLKSAMAWYLDGFSQRSGIKVTFDRPSDFPRLPADVEMALFRVLQESLTNVHRHSGSPTATIRLMAKECSFRLEISDQGKGISVPNLDEGGDHCKGTLGVGLRSMTERMLQLGGELKVTSTSEGTTIIATIPNAVLSLARASSDCT